MERSRPSAANFEAQLEQFKLQATNEQVMQRNVEYDVSAVGPAERTGVI